MGASIFTESLGYHLGRRQFVLALSLAAMLHLMGFMVYLVAPHETVIDIPVRALNLKLGGGDELEAISASETSDGMSSNNEQVEKSLGSLLAEPKAPALPVGRRGLDVLEQAIARKASRMVHDVAAGRYSPTMSDEARSAHQYVRERDPNVKLPDQPGSALGATPESKAEVLSHYEQAISSWIQRFKLYPDDARKAKLTGEAVLRVRIDRRGNIRYNVLESSTGHTVLDRAAIEMVRRANPVPPVPENYPTGEIIEFLIPVSFRQQ